MSFKNTNTESTAKPTKANENGSANHKVVESLIQVLKN